MSVHARLLQSCLTLYARLFCSWDSPDKSTEIYCHALLQRNLPDPGIEPMSLMSPESAGRLFTTGATWEAPNQRILKINF